MNKTSKPTTDPNEKAEANPHPASSHRAPHQLAADEGGPTGPRPAQSRPVSDVNPAQRIDAESASDVERRHAVKRSARKSATNTQHDTDAHPNEPGSASGNDPGSTPGRTRS